MTDGGSEDEGSLQNAASFNLFQQLIQDLFSAKDGETAVVADMGKILGNELANMLWKNLKFQCVGICNALNGLQQLIFGSEGSHGGGSDLIPTIEDFIDLIVKMLDDTFSHLIVLVANVFAGFWGMITHQTPSFGQWIEQLFEVVATALTMVSQYPMQFMTGMLGVLPPAVQEIAKLLMVGMCLGINGAGAAVVGVVDGISSTFGGGNVLPTTFSTQLGECLDKHKTWGSLNGNVDDDVPDGGYARRLQEETEDEALPYQDRYARARDRYDWNGTTLCARYGRHDTAPDNQDLWHTCVGYRKSVLYLGEITGRDYLPPTLFDDWKEPAY